jgi:hypothetical protein
MPVIPGKCGSLSAAFSKLNFKNIGRPGSSGRPSVFRGIIYVPEESSTAIPNLKFEISDEARELKVTIWDLKSESGRWESKIGSQEHQVESTGWRVKDYCLKFQI